MLEATADILGFVGNKGVLGGQGEPWRFWFLLCMSLGAGWGRGGRETVLYSLSHWDTTPKQL